MEGMTEPRDFSAQMTDTDTLRHPSWRRRLLPSLRRRRWFLLLVVLPTLVATIYFYAIAAKQYESEADFLVRNASGSQQPSIGGLGQMLSLGGMGAAQSDAFSVNDYMDSHDAISALQSSIDLVGMFRRPEADVLARLWWAQPSAETLLRYFRRQVSIKYSEDTGITAITAHAFRPEDARRIVQALLSLGEARVNELNKRATADTVRLTQLEVASAEQRVLAAEAAMTAFRMREHDIDPQHSSSGQLALMQGLQAQVAASRAQLAGMAASVSADSPQYVALRQRVQALEAQVSREGERLTGSTGAMAPVLADYESLTMEREFAEKNYMGALSALETARLQALRQQLFVVEVVRPNLPEKALFPKRTMMVATVFLGLLLGYSLGWLMIAGMREHAA